MSILQNAVDSIAIGLEDFNSDDERRLLSSTRNIFAGTLLLFKHKLCILSPSGTDEVLIKQKISPSLDASGKLNWIGKGNKTVDVQSIKERFISLGIDVNWKRLDDINKYRNDIEHYHSSLSTETVRKLISDSFIIIRDFIVNQLHTDPRILLGEEYWEILVSINEVYEKEKSECNERLMRLSYFSDTILDSLQNHHCSNCGSDFLETDDSGEAYNAKFRCRSCGIEDDYEDIIKDSLSEFYALDIHLHYTDGGELPITECPLCDFGIYLFQENICSSCGGTAIHECARCQCNIPASELSDGNLCGYCSYMKDKYMNE